MYIRSNIDLYYLVTDANESLATYQLDTSDYRFTYQSYEYPNRSSTADGIVITTVPTKLSVDLLEWNIGSTFWNSSSGFDGTTFKLLSPQPLLLTSCWELESLQNENIYSIDKSKKLLVNPLAQYERLVLSTQTLETTNLNYFPILFTPAVDDAYTLVALAPSDESPDSSNLTTWTVCTVDAFWQTAHTSLYKNALIQIKPEKPDGIPYLPNKNLRRIAFDPLFIMAASTNYTSEDLNSQGMGLIFAWVISAIPDLGSTLATSDDINTTMRGFGISQLKGQSNITQFRIDTINYGFGYGMRDLPTQLSVAAITVYCLIAVPYIGYIITTGHASIAWNSPTELIMLALQSKEPTDLGHVSVGVDSMDTLRRSVGIRVSAEEIQGTGEMKEKLELVFEDDEENEKRALTKVVRNTAY